MPICKSCLKGFDSECNICPNCNHDQSKRSFRTFFSLGFLFIFIYLSYQLSFQTITVTVDGKPSSKFFINQGLNRFYKGNKKGGITFFHLFGNETVSIYLRGTGQTINTTKGYDTKINIDTKAKVIQMEAGNFLRQVNTLIPFTPTQGKK